MSDSCGSDAGDGRVRAHCIEAADNGSGGIRRARIYARVGLFAIATLIFGAVFGGEAAAQFVPPGPTPSNNTVMSAAMSNAHRPTQATLFDVGSQFLQRFNAVYS